MATVKVFSPEGVKVLECFDTLDNVPFVPIEEEIDDIPERDPFEDE